jgi:two-component system response regulator FixJ
MTETVFVVDDDEAVRKSLGLLLKSVGLSFAIYGSAAELLTEIKDSSEGCLVLDIRMPGMSGLELQRELKNRGIENPIIFVTGHGDVPMAVQAMRDGAFEFIEKPFREQLLLDRIYQALTKDHARRASAVGSAAFRARLATLTPREREIMKRIVCGQANKVTAIELGLSERTVEIHRAKVMVKMEVRSLAELVSLAAKEDLYADALRGS